MRELRTAVFVSQFLLLCTVRSASAQDYQAQLLSEIQKAYEQLNYPEAEIKAKAALNEYQRFSPAQLTEIHKVLGIVYFSQNDSLQSRRHFQQALSINEDLKLDPVYVSPKILEFFEQIKGDPRTNNGDDIQRKPELRYVLVQDRRPAAALRSMLLPGWGQIYKGEKRKGLALSTLWGVGIAGAVAFHLARANAEDNYLAEVDPEKIEGRFNTFNRFHKLRNGFLLFSTGVWLYSYIDAFLKRSPSAVAGSDFSILPSLSTRQVMLAVLVRL
jgi:tetratricopeptide (TPR) repeat protein